MKSYVLDHLVKYHCFNCNSEFILSEYKAEMAEGITCPYCHDKDVEGYVYMKDIDKLDELGCLAIGHHEDPLEEKYRYEITWGRIEEVRNKNGNSKM